MAEINPRNISILANSEVLDRQYEAYRKASTSEDPEESLADKVKGIERTIRPDLEDFLMNATPQAIENEVRTYQESKKEEMERAAEEEADNLVNTYGNQLNNIIEGTISELTPQMKDVPEDRKEEILMPHVYQNVANLLKALGLTPNSKEVEKELKKLKDLDGMDDDKTYQEVKEYLMSQGLSSNAVNLVNQRRVLDEKVKPEQTSIYARVLAKEIITEKDGKYEIDRDKFKEIYGSTDNYKKLAYQLAAQAAS